MGLSGKIKKDSSKWLMTMHILYLPSKHIQGRWRYSSTSINAWWPTQPLPIHNCQSLACRSWGLNIGPILYLLGIINDPLIYKTKALRYSSHKESLSATSKWANSLTNYGNLICFYKSLFLRYSTKCILTYNFVIY